MKILTALLMLTIPVCLMAQAQETPKVQDVVVRLFDAFSSGKIDDLTPYVADDFTILEHGEVWTMDSIKMYFNKPRPADFRRLNSFDFFQTEISGDMAFVSYHNRAEIRANDRSRNVRWLESAVLVKTSGRWVVKMLHSTRVQVR